MFKWAIILFGAMYFANSYHLQGKGTDSQGWLKEHLALINTHSALTSKASPQDKEFWKGMSSEKYPAIILAQEDANAEKVGAQMIENTLKWALNKSSDNLQQARNDTDEKSQWKLPGNNPGKVSRPALEQALKTNPETVAYPLAYALEYGEDGQVDRARALSLYQKASEEGDIRAQSRLGIAYMKGQLGLDKDYDQAEKWLTEAAIHNDLSAQYYLGKLLLKDRNTNTVDALVWVAVAAKRGYEPAQSVVKNYWEKLKADQQDELLSRVRKWRVREPATVA